MPLNELLAKYPNLKQVVWVVARTSRHLDWNEVPEGVGGKADIAVWHDIIDDKSSTPTELPTEIPGGAIPNVVTVAEDSMSAFDSYEIIELTQKVLLLQAQISSAILTTTQNLVSAIGAQISALPRNHRIAPPDLLTPLAPLTDSYPLTVTLAALFSNASLALTPVSGSSVPYDSAFQGASPTIVIAGTQTLSDHCKAQERAVLANKLALGHRLKARTLEAGVLPKPSPLKPTPRLIYTYDKASASNAPLAHSEFFNLKLFTSARFVYAFTDPHVAGAVTQTSMLDYRNLEASQGKYVHFGPPLSSVEVKFKDSGEYKNEEGKSVGRMIVEGPAIVGGEVVTDQIMGMTEENTLIRL